MATPEEQELSVSGALARAEALAAGVEGWMELSQWPQLHIDLWTAVAKSNLDVVTRRRIYGVFDSIAKARAVFANSEEGEDVSDAMDTILCREL